MTSNFRKIMQPFFIALILCLVMSGLVRAQEETAATLTGQVTDSAGAGIPNATVIVTNTDNGAIRQVQSNNEGNYNVSPLVPGSYTVAVEQTGFKRYVQKISLNVRDRRQVAIVLEVGAPSETVTVTDEPPLIQESPTGQTLISNKQIIEIPLVNRDFTKLLELVPGVSSDLTDESSLGLTNRASISINGMRRNGVNFLVDGVNNTDGGSNITLLSTPTVDSIKEFKVLTSNYTAEFGRSAGGVVTVVTKSGGNKYHGSLYEFVRNDRFNANTFFNNRLGRGTDGKPKAPTPRLRYNTFGGTFSGPLPFLHFGEGGPYFDSGKNKTFFFYSQDFRRIRRAASTISPLVPSVAERGGDFSARLGLPLYLQSNGTSGTTVTATPLFVTDTTGRIIQAQQNQIFNTANRAYAGNIIPASDISPISRALLNAYPLPNSGTNGFSYNATTIQNTRQEVVRIDHNINQNNSIFGRYTHDLNDTQEPGGLFNGISIPNVATTNTLVPGQLLAVTYNSVLTPSITNELSYNFSQNHINTLLVGKGRLSDYGLTNGAGGIGQAFPENNFNAIPGLSIPGIAFVGSTQGFDIRYRSQVIRDNLSWTRGNHQIKFGVELAREGKNENSSNNTQGSFTFDQIQSRGTALNGATNVTLTQTGAGLASFLLGRANSYVEDQFDITFKLNLGRREFYAQDTWKIRPNVTLDYGVRYQYYVPATDKNNVESSFIPSLFSASKVPTCANAACTSLLRGTGDPLNGIAVAGSTSPFGRTIIPKDKNNFSPRVGITYSPNFEKGFGRTLLGAPTKTVFRAGYGFYYDQIATFLFEDPTVPNRPYNNRATFNSGSAGTITFTDPTAGALGNLPIISLGGVSPNLKTPEIQQFSVGMQREVFKNAVIDISYVRTKGDFLLRQRNINFVEPFRLYASRTTTAGVVVPVLPNGQDAPAGCTVGSTGCINLYRPYLGYSTINVYETAARSRYNGLLTSFSYRFAKGSTLTASYTLSKNMTDFTNDRDAVDTPQNPLNPAVEYAEARTSRRHIFSASYVYEIPFFHKIENRFLRAVLDGYQIGGITNIESGPPISRVIPLTTSGGLIGNRANLVGNPTGGVAGTIDPISGLPFIFDPAAFAAPDPGTFGNSRRAIFHLKGRNQTNLSLSRYFYLNKDKGRYLQLRAESFNVFNHTQFLGVNNQLGIGGFTNPTGTPGSTRLPREFQFAAKFNF
ncbi:MAG: TonB-dependent receptor [Acidobacteriota bacterium]|nr:TonB-dependent receptor [Acidobacteriota bacterium]